MGHFEGQLDTVLCNYAIDLSYCGKRGIQMNLEVSLGISEVEVLQSWQSKECTTSLYSAALVRVCLATRLASSDIF